MGLGDKISQKAEELTGKAKAGAGDATDNADLEAEGRAEEAEAEAEAGQTGDSVADALRDASTAIKGDTMKGDDERHMRY
ncbi:MAG TPA: CsbD family protein [Propionibacteriaceae bacterium]|jgi:uncharacterized protein YjbJ (UPF0337 family)|nr:CsbD family protein [Propionibacteriaceae bacterium]